MNLNESEKNRIRGLHKEFSVIKEQKQVLTEAKECHVTHNPCKVGKCLFDPGTNSMCCVENTQYGCMDGRIAYDDNVWVKDGDKHTENNPDWWKDWNKRRYGRENLR
jgi:hypothetical protein